jgi:hypothetical protein
VPLPAYFVCSEGVSVDKDSNRVTLFNVSEGIQLVPTTMLPQLIQGGHQIMPPTPLRIMSVWMREDSDLPEEKFQHQFLFHFPQTTEMVIGETPFSFTTARFHRLLSPPLFPGFLGPGILKVESRIRKAGESDWIGHQYFYLELSAMDISSLVPPSPATSS